MKNSVHVSQVLVREYHFPRSSGNIICLNCGVQTLTVYVNVSCVLVLSYAWVIFVSHAVCHELTYTAYTHAHTNRHV